SQSRRSRRLPVARCASIRDGGESNHLARPLFPIPCSSARGRPQQTSDSTTRTPCVAEAPMKRWEVFLGIVGAVLVLVGASAMRRAALPKQTAILGEGGCHTPVTVLEPPPGVNPLGTVILFHGLSANRGWLTY